jgi:PAS domain S-box-containing protein
MVTLRSGLPVRAQLMGIDDGRSARRWISVTAVPLRTGTGAGHDAALVTFEDVTERLRYQQEAEALLRRQRRIMDSALLGAWITREDQCTWANSRAAHLLGYTLAQLVGSPAHRIHRDAAHYNALAARAQAVLHRGEVFHADVELQRQDGCAAWFELRGVLLDPLAGEILWTIVDLGARVHSEAALIEALQESADLYDGAPAGYHTIGADGLILRMNATELRWLDYRRDEVIGRRHFSDFLSPDSRAAADAMLLKSPRPGEDYGLEVDLVRRDGSLMPVLINASPVTDAAGSYVMARCIVIDLSALRAAQQQLLRSEQAYLAVIQDLRLQVARGAPPR